MRSTKDSTKIPFEVDNKLNIPASLCPDMKCVEFSRLLLESSLKVPMFVPVFLIRTGISTPAGALFVVKLIVLLLAAQ